MNDFWGKTDNSVSTRLRYDLVAEHQVRAYDAAIRKMVNSKREDETIFRIIFFLLKNCIILPLFYLVKLAFLAIWNYVQKRPKTG